LFLNIIWITLKNKKTPKKSTLSIIDERLNLGNYEFFPNQNKLTLKGKDIQLSKKEGDLLTILIANLNQVVKREDLTKKVWEDNGVVVGRSLDTYISKLRKKLKEDSTIKISNIHGVGYKLESLK
jgi:DNA-binding response OmpR family regulator